MVSNKIIKFQGFMMSTALLLAVASVDVKAHGGFEDLAIMDGLDPMNVPVPTGLAPGSSSCSSAKERNNSLIQDQRRVMEMVAGFKTLNNDFDLAALSIILGYALPTHQAVSFKDMGLAIASVESLSGQIPHSGRPSLLLYKPNSTQNTTEQFYYDYPLTLSGWAYASTYEPLERPVVPGLCLFKKDWFFHEQGVHPFFGMGFAPTPPSEPWVGADKGSVFQPFGHGWPFGIYHSRLWDIHVFLDGSKPQPTVSIIKKNSGITGIDSGVGTAFKYPDY